MTTQQQAYAVAKVALQAAIAQMALEEEACPFAEGSDEYYAFGDELSLKYDYCGLTDALRTAEENLMTWAHETVMKLPQAKKHEADLVMVYDLRNSRIAVRHKLIDLALRLSA